jgi:hypothetical protein
MQRTDTRSLRNRIIEFFKRLLGHRQLPTLLAAGAILAMLPALKTGLAMDDLIQRPFQFKASQLPVRMRELLPPDSGSLRRVLAGLFGSIVNPAQVALAKDYGLLGWWGPDAIKCGLWRPFTAFTHWLDYRLFPDSPALMHAHNIGWFAAAIFILAVVYHKLAGPAWLGGLAGVLFLLDKNTYFPVMFVANRGFVVALVFGLAALSEHHRWRTTQSRLAMVLSLCSLAVSLFANEGGASSLAFILAYALVLEPGSWRRRALTALPAIIVIIGWRLIYQGLGYGVADMGGGVNNAGGYIDPSYEPLRFAGQLGPRVLALAGGQFTGIPPDVLLLLNPSWQSGVAIFYLLCLAAGGLVFLPLVRQNAPARFWFAVTALALIPAATVTPLSKNLAFVAVGAFGLVACFVGGLISGSSWAPKALPCRVLSWTTCVWLLLAHVPGALVGRIANVKFTPLLFGAVNRVVGIEDSPNIGEQEVILVNTPLQIATVYAPCYRLYRGQALPRSIRALVPGCTGLELKRTDEKTLIVQTRASDIFACDDLGAAHVAYLFNSLDGIVVGRRPWKPGDRQILRGLTVEILEVSKPGLPVRVAFHFEQPLDSPLYHWLRFDWRRFSYGVFSVPRVGETVWVEGPVR